MYFYLAKVGSEPTPTSTAAPSNTETTVIPTRYIYMVGLNHQQCKTMFTERFRLSPSSEFTGVKIQNFNISTGILRKYKIIMNMFLNLLFKITLNDQRN